MLKLFCMGTQEVSHTQLFVILRPVFNFLQDSSVKFINHSID